MADVRCFIIGPYMIYAGINIEIFINGFLSTSTLSVTLMTLNDYDINVWNNKIVSQNIKTVLTTFTIMHFF